MRSTSSVTPTDPAVLLRPAESSDLSAVAEVHVAARVAAVATGAMPPAVHTDDEVRAWVAGWDLTAYDVWVADVDGRVVAYARATATWLDDLYVLPAHQGSGVGGALLGLVQAGHPDGFGLWVFESNAPARAFYRRCGLVERERTDGSENEEGEPDVRMEWVSVSPDTMAEGQDVG
jgi:GNAT superfamily N-acetyltransferase